MTYTELLELQSHINNAAIICAAATVAAMIVDIRRYFKTPGFILLLASLCITITVYLHFESNNAGSGIILVITSFITAMIGGVFLSNFRKYEYS